MTSVDKGWQFVDWICNICVICSYCLPGELWRLEDDMEGEDESGQSGVTEARPRSQSPFSHFRVRAAYLRKSVSADDHLDIGSDYSSGNAVEGKTSRSSKGKLKRKFVSFLNHYSSTCCSICTLLVCRLSLEFSNKDFMVLYVSVYLSLLMCLSIFLFRSINVFITPLLCGGCCFRLCPPVCA